jgi:hypothetical protein
MMMTNDSYPVVPPPPQYQLVPVRPPGHGQAVASMVLGICSVVFCWWGLATIAMATLAVVFGARQLHRSGMAVAGIACGSVGAVLWIIFGIATLGVGFFV